MYHTKLYISALLSAVVLSGVAAIPARAHHSFTAEYDRRNPVTLHGSVVKFEMLNPHGWITLDVKSEAALPIRWMIELPNPDILQRAGWKKDSLKPGDSITVQAYQARDGSHAASADSLLLPDGRKLPGGAPVTVHDETPR
jgi:hypothetical protein